MVFLRICLLVSVCFVFFLILKKNLMWIWNCYYIPPVPWIQLTQQVGDQDIVTTILLSQKYVAIYILKGLKYWRDNL